MTDVSTMMLMTRWTPRASGRRGSTAPAPSSGSTIGQRDERSVTGRLLAVGVELGALVGDLVVGVASRTGDARSLDVVLDLVVVGEQPAAVGQREQERGDAERDDDRGERQRLRQRVG